jgi:hypothetical protein
MGERDGGAPGNPAGGEVLRLLLAFLLLAASSGASAAAAAVIFAGVSEASAILGWEDDYVRATRPLERRLLARSKARVGPAEFREYMAAQAREWTDEERRRLEPLRERLEQLSAKLRARLPARILLIKAADVLDGAPHTRVNAIVLPQQFVATARREALAYVLAHELFHLLSRHDDQARERLYAAIGFHPCERVELPHSLERERITNPDAPQDRHTIRARYRGQPVEAMPVSLLSSGTIDPAKGLLGSLDTPWLLVERSGGTCRATGRRAQPDELDGLFQQIGRNTEYLIHPEEILADNFVVLALPALAGREPYAPSPAVLERMRAILF